MITPPAIGAATVEDRQEVVRLLQHHHLPVEGLADHWATALVARRDGRVVGSAALEIYLDGALLRSVAVADEERGHGLGHQLTTAALELARQRQMPAVYLLTTTADQFFPKLGFERITRDDVPSSVQASVEFRSACPASAVPMRARL